MSRRKLIQFVDNAGNSVRAISHPLVAGGNSHHCTVRIAIQKLPSDCPTFVGTRSVMVGVTVTRSTHDTISCSPADWARLSAVQFFGPLLAFVSATHLRHCTVGNCARHHRSPLPSHPLPSPPLPSHPLPSHPLPSHPLPSHPLPSHPLPSHP